MSAVTSLVGAIVDELFGPASREPLEVYCTGEERHEFEIRDAPATPIGETVMMFGHPVRCTCGAEVKAGL